MEKLGDLKVYAIRNGEESLYKVESPEDAFKLINNLADADLRNSAIEYNCFGLLVYEYGVAEHGGDDWCEWYNHEGESMDDLIRQGDDYEGDIEKRFIV